MNVCQCDVDFNALKYVMMSEGEIEPLSKYEELKRDAIAEEVNLKFIFIVLSLLLKR